MLKFKWYGRERRKKNNINQQHNAFIVILGYLKVYIWINNRFVPNFLCVSVCTYVRMNISYCHWYVNVNPNNNKNMFPVKHPNVTSKSEIYWFCVHRESNTIPHITPHRFVGSLILPGYKFTQHIYTQTHSTMQKV